MMLKPVSCVMCNVVLFSTDTEFVLYGGKD